MSRGAPDSAAESIRNEIDHAHKIIEQSRKHAEKVLRSKMESDKNNSWRIKLFTDADKISFVKVGDDIPINGTNSRWINVYYDFKFIGKIFAYSNLEREVIEVTIYFCKKFADYDFNHGKLIKYYQYTTDFVANGSADSNLRSMIFKNCPMLNNRSTNLGETFNTASLSSNQERRVFTIDVSDLPANQVDAYMKRVSNEIRSGSEYEGRWRKLAYGTFGIQGSVNMPDINKESVGKPRRIAYRQLSKEEQLNNAIAYFDVIKASNNYIISIKKELISDKQYHILSLFMQFKSKFKDFIQEDSIVNVKKIFDDGIYILLVYNDKNYNIWLTENGVFCNDDDFTWSIAGLYKFICKPQPPVSKLYTKIKEWALNRILFYYNCVT